jgi:hypothetical protein
MRIETGHVQLLISYTLRADVEESDYDEWARQVAKPWWENQPGYRALRGYYTVLGSGARIYIQVDVDHYESLAKILGSESWHEMRRDLSRFAEDIDARMLAPTGRTPS